MIALTVAFLSALTTLQTQAEPVPDPTSEAAFSRGPVRVDATRSRNLLPKAARRAVGRRHAEVLREGDRWIVRPTDAWLAAEEHRPGMLHVSDDAGRTWRTMELPDCGNAGCILRLEAGGHWQMMTGTEAPCGGGGQSRFAGDLASGQWSDAPWPWDSPLSFTLPADGWAATDCNPTWSGRSDWKGPERVPCLVDLAGRELYLPVAWDDRNATLDVDLADRRAAYAGRTFPLADARPPADSAPTDR